jgi:type IV secretion/conjugal transfer VirB4 family ATPase
MFSLKEYREPAGRLPDYLPWAFCISDTTVLQKDGMLLRCWRYRGPDLAAASPNEQVALAARVNAALARLGSGWAIWVEMARHQNADYPQSEFPTLAARIVDLEARSLFAQAKVVHESQYYLSLGWMTPSDQEASVADTFYATEGGADYAGVRKLEFEYFERICTEISDILTGVFLEFEALRGEALLSYLKSCVSTQRQRVLMPDCPAYLDAYLPDEAFTSGEISLLGDNCLALFSIRGFPKSTPFGMLDELCHLGIEFRWVTRFLPLDRDQAQNVIGRHQRRHFMSRKSLAKYGSEMLSGEESKLQNPIAADKADEATAALRLLGGGDLAFGYFTSTLAVWDPDPDVARRKATELKKIVQRRGLVALDETLHGLHAWLGMVPGHVHANVRRPLLHTANLVRLMPIMSTYTGQRENAHLKALTGVGTPHVCCISGTSRFDLTLAVGDVGHTLVAGPTGAGKTTFAGVLELLWTKYPGAKVIIYDYGGGARAATLAVGGAYYTPGTLDGSCAFQPLRNIHEPAERAWAVRWMLQLLDLRKISVDHNVELAVEQVLDAMAVDPDLRTRTLTQFNRLFGSYYPELAAALRMYTLEGEYGHIFDADRDPLGDAPWRAYEMKPMLKCPREVFVPVLQYLGHRDEGMVDGSPLLKIKDECWRFWDDPAMLSDTRADVKTGRVNNTYNVYLTQEVSDVAANPQLMSALLTNCKTHIYLPNPDATIPALAAQYAAFGLTPTEIQLLAKATPKLAARAALVLFAHRSGRARVHRRLRP